MIRRLAALLITYVFALSGCGEEGAAGPTGPQGAVPAEPSGAANVVYTDWFTPASYNAEVLFDKDGLLSR